MSTGHEETPLPDGFRSKSAIVLGPVPHIGSGRPVAVAVDTSHGVVPVWAALPMFEQWGPDVRPRICLDFVASWYALVNPDALLMAVEDEARAAVAEALVAAWGPQ